VAEALRSAPLSLRNSQTAPVAYFRHGAQRLGLDLAFATAKKLATLIYGLLAAAAYLGYQLPNQ